TSQESTGPVQLANQFHPGHHVPFRPRHGNFLFQFLFHGRRRSGLVVVIAFHFGRGLAFFDSGFFLCILDVGRGLFAFGPALFPSAATTTTTLATLLPLSLGL